MSTATSIGPYQLIGKTLYSANGCQVRVATHPALPGFWAIKVKPDNHYEIKWIQPLIDNKIRSCVVFPSDLPATGALESRQEWVAMRAYDGHVDSNTWCRSRWKQIGLAVLDFLEDIHTKMRVAHLDIKIHNILIDKTNETFHVCDFEHMTHVDDFNIEEPLRNYSREYKWYYVLLGGELDQPFDSWRIDFEALGFVFACLTWPENSGPSAAERATWPENSGPSAAERATWQKGVSIGFATECRERMEGKGTLTMTDEEVIALREYETATYADPLVSAYLSLVSNLSWTQTDPPPAAFYESLREVLRT